MTVLLNIQILRPGGLVVLLRILIAMLRFRDPFPLSYRVLLTISKLLGASENVILEELLGPRNLCCQFWWLQS